MKDVIDKPTILQLVSNIIGAPCYADVIGRTYTLFGIVFSYLPIVKPSEEILISPR